MQKYKISKNFLKKYSVEYIYNNLNSNCIILIKKK